MGSVSHQQLLEHDWSDISRRLTLFVYGRLGRGRSMHDAEEIAQEAVRRFLDPNYAQWDQGREPSLVRHLGSIANGVLSDRRQRKSSSNEELRDVADMAEVDASEDVETRVASAEVAARSLAALRERLAKDRVALDILELIIRGVDEPREQARQLSLAPREVYNARRRIALHRDAIRNLIDEPELSHGTEA